MPTTTEKYNSLTQPRKEIIKILKKSENFQKKFQKFQKSQKFSDTQNNNPADLAVLSNPDLELEKFIKIAKKLDFYEIDKNSTFLLEKDKDLTVVGVEGKLDIYLISSPRASAVSRNSFLSASNTTTPRHLKKGDIFGLEQYLGNTKSKSCYLATTDVKYWAITWDKNFKSRQTKLAVWLELHKFDQKSKDSRTKLYNSLSTDSKNLLQILQKIDQLKNLSENELLYRVVLD